MRLRLNLKVRATFTISPAPINQIVYQSAPEKPTSRSAVPGFLPGHVEWLGHEIRRDKFNQKKIHIDVCYCRQRDLQWRGPWDR